MDFSRISFTCEKYPSLSSTQSYGRRWFHLHPGSPPHIWHWIVAETQENGYGTHGRSWISHEGGFYGTLCFHWPRAHKNLLQFLPLCGAFSAALTVEHFICDSLASSPPFPFLKIKWINDMLWNGKKISGILAETIGIDEEKEWVQCLLGIGININNIPHQQESYPVTSLFHETQKKYDLEVVRIYLEETLRKSLSSIFSDIHGFLFSLHQRLLYYEEMVHIQDGKEVFYGKIMGVSPEGGLMLNMGPQGIKRFFRGSLAKNLTSMAK